MHKKFKLLAQVNIKTKVFTLSDWITDRITDRKVRDKILASVFKYNFLKRRILI